MIAYEELVVALTNWRIQQGLGTTGLQFTSQRSGRVNLDLPVADPDSLVEEIVDADYADEIVSMDELEEVRVLEATEDPNSLASTVPYDGEHTSIAEDGSLSSEEGSEELVEAALDYASDDTQYMDAPSSPDEVSGDAEEASALEASAAEDSELAVDEPIDAAELEVEEHELVEEQELIDATSLESMEVDPSRMSEFDEKTQMGMGASSINLAPGSVDELVDSSNPTAKPDEE